MMLRIAQGSGRLRQTTTVLLVGAMALALAAGCSDSSDDGAGGRPEDSSSSTQKPDAACDGTLESPDPSFVVDSCGRVLILRGVNVESSAKGAAQSDPHLPASDLADQVTLQRWGWNTVRFLVFWGAIEPTDGKFDDSYLNEVEGWLDWYADHDIHVVIDLHQDLYAWAVGGNGAPDWAVDTQGLTASELAEGQPWYLQGADPAVQAAYQSFWNPKQGQRDFKQDYLEVVEHLAERFSDHPAVLGYDVMNEPVFANGDLDATLAIQGEAAAGTFVNDNLTGFMQGGIDAVRRQDDDAWVMVEPTSLLNAFPYPGDLAFEELTDPRDGPSRLSYAGHLYQPEVHDGKGYPAADPYLESWETYRTAEAERMQGPLWIGEWGGPDQEGMDDYVQELTDMADRAMAGWAYWSWDPGGWSPVEEDGTTTSANGQRLLRVQPRAIAGTPNQFAWNGEKRTFTMSWTERDGVVGPTELAVPAVLFDAGVEVIIDGEVFDADWDRDRSVLTIPQSAADADRTLCLQPAGADSCPS